MRARMKILLLCIIVAMWAVPAFGTDTRTMKITLSIPNTPPELSATNAEQNIKKGDTLQVITITAAKGDWITWTHNLPSDWSVIIADDTKSCTITPPSSSGLRSGTYTYTVTTSNDKGSDTQPITITIQGGNVDSSLLASDGAFTGTPQEPATSKTPAGQSMTATETTFTDIHDRLMLSADIAIITESSDLAGIAGVPFTQTVSIDVSILLNDQDYGIYTYSLDIANLPDWLSASGELISTDNNLAGGITVHHHEFTLSGTPQAESDPVDVVFTAAVSIIGDTPVLRATGSKTVKISAEAPVLISLDASLVCETLTLYAGNTGTISPSLTVRGKYSDGSIKTLAHDDYSAQWSTASPDLQGISLTDGTLNVSASAQTGTYDVPVSVIASSGNLEASAEIRVTITVNDVAPSGITASPSEVEVTAGEAVSITVTLDAGTNIIWSLTGELPNGVSVSSGDKTLTISGTTSLEDADQDFTLTAAAMNEAGEVSTNIIIHVADVQPALVSDTFSVTAYKGEAFSLIVTASAGTNLVWNMTGNLPSGLAAASENDTFTISGIPAAGTSGNYSFTVTASNSKGNADAAVNIAVKGRSYSDHNEAISLGTSEEPSVSVDSEGRSITSTETVFWNGGGNLTSSIDIAFTTESTDFSGVTGITFTKTISVDVTLKLNDPDYGIYTYSLDVEDLPEWLEISGDIVSTDENLGAGITAYHHEFTLLGTPQTESAGVDVIFTATVNISGDTPIMRAVGSKNVKISAKGAELVSLDVSLSSEILTLNYGEGSTISPVLSVKGKYSDGSIRTLAPTEYSAEWSTASPDIDGLAFENWTLSVAASLAVGTYNFPVKVSVRSVECEAAVEGIVRVIVNDVIPAGISADSTDVKTLFDEAVNVNITLAYGTNVVWKISGELPSGFSVVSGDRTVGISGTASKSDAGRTFMVTLTASNTAGSESITIKFTVLDAVSVLSSKTISWNASEGAAFSQSITATGTNIVWGYSGKLPSGLSISSSDKTFTVSGTPSFGSAGTYSLSVTASNTAGTAEANITLTIYESGANLQPKQDAPLTTTDSDGKSITSTFTTFSDSTGSLLASIDVALTSASTDFSAVTGLMFSQTFSVDVAFSFGTDGFTGYTYSLDIEGLPEWLKVSGEILSMDSEVKRTYHHEFVLSGKPLASEAANIVFTATIKVSGDTSILDALGRKDVKILLSPVSVLALNAAISCDNLSLDEGSSVKISPLLTVRADLTDGSSTYLASHDYSVSWSTSSTDIKGITFADGVLTVGTDALAGTYSFPVSAAVKHGNLEVSASKNIIINVNRRESNAQKSVASIDIEITTSSNAFTLSGGQTFSQTIIIDVDVQAASSNFDTYTYSADISGLPEWLKTDGETAYSSDLTARKYHHEFRIYGTAPENSASVRAIISVNAELSGGAEVLRASASKDVHIYVNAVSTQPESPAPSSPSSPASQNNAELPDATPNSSENEPSPENNFSPTPEPSTEDNSLPDSEPSTEDNSLPNHDSLTENTLIPPPPTDSYLATGEINSLEQELSLADIAQSMTQEELDAVRTLRVDANVNDLSGLENFSCLERIDLTGATALRTVTISGNSSVREFYAPGNNSLQSINLSGSNVVYIDVSRCSSLEELDASDCEFLTRLECQDCRIRKLNISGSRSLQYIDCSRNSLSILDAGVCENLNSLYCYNQEFVYPLSQREFSFERLAEASGVQASGNFSASGFECVINLRAWNFAGREISADYDVLSGNVIFGDVPAKFVYDYFTGFRDVNMDVTVFSDSAGDDNTGYEAEDGTGTYGSGGSGGCSGTAISLCGLALVLILRRR